jgi:hypothetical protein
MNLAAKPLLFLIATFLLAGCASTPTQRIEEKKEEFAALTPEDQQAVKAGVIKVGYTPDMVYMALGQPSAVKTQAEMETWEYRNYVPSETVAKGRPAQNNAGLAGHHSGNITAWDSSRLPSEGSARGDVNNYESRGSAPQGMAAPVVVPSVTLFVFFQQGKVSEFKIER